MKIGINIRKKAIVKDIATEIRLQDGLREFNHNNLIINQKVTHSGSIYIY